MLDGNTKIQVEESSDENIIRFDVAGGSEIMSKWVLLVITFTSGGITSNNLTVTTGNLTVNGTTTTVSTTNTVIADNILELNNGISASTNDAGVIVERGSTGNNAAVIWDESADLGSWNNNCHRCR